MAVSIAARMRRALLGLALGLSLVFATLTLLLLYVMEDQLFLNLLDDERRLLEAAPADQRDDWQPGYRHMQLFTRSMRLPEDIHEYADVSPGVYEHFDQRSAFFVLVGAFPDSRERYYLVYDVRSLLAVRSSRQLIFLIVGFGTLIICIVAAAMALYLSRKTLKPLRKLSDQLDEVHGDELPRDFAAEFAGDEIGILAQTLESAMTRARASAEREYEFNRGVNHELRTPIQVAKSAVELLRLKGDADGAPLERLSRSVSQMENITEAFLWLASERSVADGAIDARASLEKIIEEHRHLLAGKPVAIKINAPDVVPYRITEPLFAVIIGNLLRNAFQNTDKGIVRCSLNPDRILVEDTGVGLERPSSTISGFGIGLTIVERICERSGWTLSVNSREGGGVVAAVDMKQAR